MKLSAILQDASQRFAEVGIESHQADAEILLAHVLDVSRGELTSMIFMDASIESDKLRIFEELLVKRADRFPLQHLTGTAAFRKIELAVGPGVFVPRFETEVIVGKALEFLASLDFDTPVVVDLATGSGAIALSVAVEFPTAEIHAVELSEQALEYSKRNFQKYAANADLRQGDLSAAFPDLNGLVDVVISNPPYIPDEMIPIYPEVQLHDPKLALYGGADGLDIVRNVELTAKRLLKPGGSLFIEHADMQGEAVRAILLATGWHEVKTHQDLAGRDRLVSAIR